MGATMSDNIHIPEDIGDNSAKAGSKPVAQSYPFVLASDALISYVNVFPPKNDAEKLNPVFSPISDNTFDMFALSKQAKSRVLFRNVSNYDIESSQWSYQLADTTESGTLPQGSESIVWTGRVNARAFYVGSLAEVKFLPDQSAIQLRSYPIETTTGYQQTLLYSNRLFSASVNPIFVTVAVAMTLSSNPNCSKTWGLFAAKSGYFFRIYGTGAADNFALGYRNTLGSTTNEVEIKRSSFNGDKLDGSNGHTQTFTKVGMFGIEIGTAGIGARFWAYVTTGNTAKWVIVHSLYNDSDSSQDRITDDEGLPISFEIKNIGQSTILQTLSKYGTSVTSLGAAIGNPDIESIATSKTVFSLGVRPLPVLGIRPATFINNLKNFNNILGSKISIAVSTGVWRIILIKDPVIDPLTKWSSYPNSALEYSLDEGIEATKGTDLCHFLVSNSKPLCFSLKDIFAVNRTFLTAQYTNDVQAIGDFGQQFLMDSSELWLCAVDANAPFPGNEIIWNPKYLASSLATYENINLTSVSSLSAQINVSLNVLEV